MNSEQNLLLGPVEWAVVTKYLFTPGFFLHLEDSGDEVFMDSMSFSDDPACCQFEYWPDLGERIRVRRFPDDGRGQIRVTGKASRLAGLTRGYPTRELGLPAGLGPIELGRVIEHRDRDILVRLEDSDRIGVLSEQTLLYESGRRVHERLTTYEDGEYRKHWPAVGARIQVQRLGVWPDGELRLAGRSMVSAPGWPLHSRADRSWNWSTEYTRALPPQVVDRVRAVADAVSLRDWSQAEELTSDNRLDWEQADAFMTTYGGGDLHRRARRVHPGHVRLPIRGRRRLDRLPAVDRARAPQRRRDLPHDHPRPGRPRRSEGQPGAHARHRPALPRLLRSAPPARNTRLDHAHMTGMTGGPLGALQAGRCATWHDIAHPPSAPHRENPVIPRKKMSAAHN